MSHAKLRWQNLHQTCPWLLKFASMAPLTALSMCASSKMTNGDFPPSSSVTYLMPCSSQKAQCPFQMNLIIYIKLYISIYMICKYSFSRAFKLEKHILRSLSYYLHCIVKKHHTNLKIYFSPECYL